MKSSIDKAIIKMMIIPITCIAMLMFTIFMVVAYPQSIGNHFPDLFKDLLLTFI